MPPAATHTQPPALPTAPLGPGPPRPSAASPQDFFSFASALGPPRPSAASRCRTALTTVAILALVLLAGCASLQGQKADAKDLQATVEAFNSSIRWGDFRTASAMIPDRDQDKFWEDAETFKQNTRIANLEIRTVKIEGLNGRAHIAFTYYRLSDPSFRSLVLHQTWRFDPDRQAWLVEDSQLQRLLP